MDIEEDPIARFARTQFGLDYLYPYQRLAIANVLDSREHAELEEAGPLRQVVILPTGYGKSLCFQLPALLLPRPTLVIYPLLALMEDQKRRLEGLGMSCACFRGGMEGQARKEEEDSLRSGAAKIVMTNPECLERPWLLDLLAELKPSHVVIDEAHCVHEWGQSFRPAYRRLGAVLDRLSPDATSAFTATAGTEVLNAVAGSLFGGRAYRLIEANADRPNISYAVRRTLSREHSLDRLAGELPKPLVIFCSSRDGALIHAQRLASVRGRDDVRFYHAGLSRDEKLGVEGWFFGS
ncbi:MAG TPA: DEAD/DEAH box helicase, partial [Rectinemataceae bacterium]|nr:DEAD/DEAH box helicase [Rectinemataceae bacterium]